MTKIVNECNHIIRTLLYTDVPLLYSPSDIGIFLWFLMLKTSSLCLLQLDHRVWTIHFLQVYFLFLRWYSSLVIPKEHQDSIQSRLDQIHQLFNKQTQLESQYNIVIFFFNFIKFFLVYQSYWSSTIINSLSFWV